MLANPTLILAADDPTLGRQRLLAMSDNRKHIGSLLRSLIAEAVSDAHGPCAYDELHEAERLRRVAGQLRIDA